NSGFPGTHADASQRSGLLAGGRADHSWRGTIDPAVSTVSSEMCLNVAGAPVLVAFPPIDRSVGSSVSRSAVRRLYRRRDARSEVCVGLIRVASFAAYDRGRSILDRHRHGPATAIQNRTSRYTALEGRAPGPGASCEPQPAHWRDSLGYQRLRRPTGSREAGARLR